MTDSHANSVSVEKRHDSGRRRMAVARPDGPNAAGGGKKAKRSKGVQGDKEHDDAKLIKALDHPLRREALRALNASKRPASPKEINEWVAEGDHLGSVSYHVRVLAELGAVSFAGDRQVRGATQNFYISEVSKVAWVRRLLKSTQERDRGQAAWMNSTQGRKGVAPKTKS